MTDSAEEKIPFFNDPAKRSLIYQVGVVMAVAALGYYLMSNTLANLDRQSIATGFGFLEKESSFEIGETLIAYSAADNYARALLVGVLNTLKVSFIGIVLTVFLGTLIGIARLSTNWLVSKLAAVYIELLQDIPVLLQLFFWYAFFYEVLPAPRQALNPMAGVFVCNRGLMFGVPADHPTFGNGWDGLSWSPWCSFSLFVGGLYSACIRPEKPFPFFWGASVALLLGAPLIRLALGRNSNGNGCSPVERVQFPGRGEP
jgi:general L-amino acid transport system permease protein